MHDPTTHAIPPERSPSRGGVGRVAGAALAALMLLGGPPAAAGDRTPVHARSGLDLATAAATLWSQDATLVYLENDEPFDTHGASLRWAYLFYSPALRKSRGYSVRGGRIVVAEDLAMKFEAPPVGGDWIDSAAAFTIADEGPARRFRHEHDGRLDAMVLLRGALESDQPDRTAWMLIYSAPNLPSLFVVLDAADGRVLRTWRG